MPPEATTARDGRFRVLVAGEVLESDRLLIATGRAPNTAGLNLESIKIQTSAQGAIEVDSGMRSFEQRRSSEN